MLGTLDPSLVGALVSSVSLVVLVLAIVIEMKMKRRLYARELEQKDQLMELERDRIEILDRDREVTVGSLAELVGPLSRQVAVELKNDVEWAQEALRKAKLVPHQAVANSSTQF